MAPSIKKKKKKKGRKKLPSGPGVDTDARFSGPHTFGELLLPF